METGLERHSNASSSLSAAPTAIAPANDDPFTCLDLPMQAKKHKISDRQYVGLTAFVQALTAALRDRGMRTILLRGSLVGWARHCLSNFCGTRNESAALHSYAYGTESHLALSCSAIP